MSLHSAAPDHLLDAELECAVDLAQRAGQSILEIYRTDFDVCRKQLDQSYVTSADHSADLLIRTGLTSRFPMDGVLTEESADDLLRLEKQRVWIVDPLDGTRQFVERVDEFAVMIGLAIGGEARLGVIHLPTERKTFAGVVGRGAWLYDGTQRRLLPPLARLEPGEPLTMAVSRHHAGRRTMRVAERIGAGDCVRSGSVGRKVALVLDGTASAYVNLGQRSHLWDACAADALMRAGGGCFADTQGRALDYHREGTANLRGLVACRPGLLDRIVSAVAEVIASG